MMCLTVFLMELYDAVNSAFHIMVWKFAFTWNLI